MRRATLLDPDDDGAAGGIEGQTQTHPGAAAAADPRRLRRAVLAAEEEGEEEGGDGGIARLLVEQQAFLSSQQAPAARLIRRDTPAGTGGFGFNWIDGACKQSGAIDDCRQVGHVLNSIQ